jgi:xylulokinase
MGERTPHCDPDVRAGLVGLAASHTRAHVIRAVLEGVAFSLRDSFEIFSDLDVPVASIRVGGGGARSAEWRAIQAGVYGRSVSTVRAEEGAAHGAAILAGVGAGVWPSVPEACDQVVRTGSTTACDGEVKAILNEQYVRYRRMYHALRAIYEPSL